MFRLSLQPGATWAEGRAPQKCDPSADPGAESKGAAGCPPRRVACRFVFDLASGDKLSRQEAATAPAGSRWADGARLCSFCFQVVNSAPWGISP